jgi:hypothetical protein
MYGTEARTVTSRDGNRLQASEMRYLRAVIGCTRQNNLKNKNISKELGAELVMKKVIGCRDNRILRIERMLDERIQRRVMKHQPMDAEPFVASGKMDRGEA